MVTTAQYDNALVRLMELSNLHIVPGDADYREQQSLLELRERYEDEHNAEVQEQYGWPGDGSGEDDFADYNQNEGNDW